MISDEPDEDADTLDDNGLLDVFLDKPQAASTQGAQPAPTDWPSRPSRLLDAIYLDADIVNWFQVNHQDWQQQIRGVLRGWIATMPDTRVPTPH
jgi:uncharacterized protein (DUF4415 family)